MKKTFSSFSFFKHALKSNLFCFSCHKRTVSVHALHCGNGWAHIGLQKTERQEIYEQIVCHRLAVGILCKNSKVEYRLTASWSDFSVQPPQYWCNFYSLQKKFVGIRLDDSTGCRNVVAICTGLLGLRTTVGRLAIAQF